MFKLTMKASQYFLTPFSGLSNQWKQACCFELKSASDRRKARIFVLYEKEASVYASVRKKAIVFVVYEKETLILVSVRRKAIVFGLQEKRYSYKLRFGKKQQSGTL